MKNKLLILNLLLVSLPLLTWAGPVEIRPPADVTVQYDAATGTANYSSPAGTFATLGAAAALQSFPVPGTPSGSSISAGANELLLNGQPILAPLQKSANVPRPTPTQHAPVDADAFSAQAIPAPESLIQEEIK